MLHMTTNPTHLHRMPFSVDISPLVMAADKAGQSTLRVLVTVVALHFAALENLVPSGFIYDEVVVMLLF